MEWLNGLRNYGYFKLRAGFSNFSAAWRRNYASEPKCFRDARTCYRWMASLLGLGFYPPPGRPKTMSFLSVCLSRFWTSEFVHTISQRRRCNRETIVILLDRVLGKVCSCAPVINFLRSMPTLATSQKAKLDKMVKFGISRQRPEGDRINRSRRNLSYKRRPWVCSSTQIWLSSVQLGAPQMLKLVQNCTFFVPGRWHNKFIQIKFGT